MVGCELHRSHGCGSVVSSSRPGSSQDHMHVVVFPCRVFSFRSNSFCPAYGLSGQVLWVRAVVIRVLDRFLSCLMKSRMTTKILTFHSNQKQATYSTNN
jgi:hypothetical protein